MSQNTTRILERIKALEKEQEKLLPLRKEEIFNVLQAAGGLTLDNKLLAGLAVYVSDSANHSSEFLRELSELGKRAMPSRRSNVRKASAVKGSHGAKACNQGSSVSANTAKEAEAHG